MNKAALVLIFLITTLSVSAEWINPLDIRKDLPPSSIHDSNITEEEFKSTIQAIQAEYAPIVSQHNAKLSMSGDWKSETLNAFARQMMGTWQVQITGGLARRPELSKDGFALILCHELGHHLGGFSMAGSPIPLPIPIDAFKPWAANEGQSDYFASQVCARKLWADELEKNKEFRVTANAKVVRMCDQTWTAETEQNLCYRIITGVESLGATLAALTNKPLPDLETPDPNAVTKTSNDHPAPQCRVDTGAQGAVCKASFDETIIPGKNSAGGAASVEAEKEAAKYSCMASSGYEVGLRPNCWFKARL